ncbi:hypothetical protein EC968_009578 [Mortierella alpina]|nr:hypothetical protein EC968_009578 [Mortierella alpina]
MKTVASTKATSTGSKDSFGIDKLEIYDDSSASSRPLQAECSKGSLFAGALVRKLLSRTVPDPTQLERQRLSDITTQQSVSSRPTSVAVHGPLTQVREQLKDPQYPGSTVARLTADGTGAKHNQKERKRVRVETDDEKDALAAATSEVTAHKPQPKPDKRLKVEGFQPEQDLQTFDLSLEGEYSADIFAYLREMEILLAPSIGYLERRSDAFWINRQYYVNRLAGIHGRIQSNLETLFLAVNIFDRVLSKKQLQPRRTHNNAVIALTCLLIASKFEERNIYANICMFIRFTDLFDDQYPNNDIDARAFRDCDVRV